MTSDTCRFERSSNREVTMAEPRKVPGIARGPQQFSRATQPPIQSPMMQGIPQQMIASPQPEPTGSSMQDLAMEIYADLAAELIATGNPDPEAMHTLARHAVAAARIFTNVLEDEANA